MKPHRSTTGYLGAAGGRERRLIKTARHSQAGRSRLPILLSALLLILAVILSLDTYQRNRRAREGVLKRLAGQIEFEINGRMEQIAQGVLLSSGLLAASDHVEPGVWEHYIEAIQGRVPVSTGLRWSQGDSPPPELLRNYFRGRLPEKFPALSVSRPDSQDRLKVVLLQKPGTGQGSTTRWVWNEFDTREVLVHLLQDELSQELRYTDFSVSDEKRILYRSNSMAVDPAWSESFSVYGARWKLAIYPKPALDQELGTNLSSYLLPLGGLLAFLIYGFIRFELQTQQSAGQKARYLSQELVQKTTELQKRNSELRTFVNVVADDLKEPLDELQGLTSELLERCTNLLPERSVVHLEKTQDRVLLMERLLEDLIAYASLDIESFQEISVDTRELLGEALKLCELPHDSQVRIDGYWPLVQGPAAPLKQVFLNLISNAIQYRGSDPLVLNLSCRETERDYFFLVQDNGVGIDPQHHTRIFKMFQRVERDRDGGGTGVGLAIVRKVLMSCGGDIRVESELGRGSTFEVRWPKVNR